jgi:hypothetical protein
MKYQALLPLIATALVLFAEIPPARAQVPDAQLREHIVRSLDEKGQIVWRDDRIPTIPDTSVCFLYIGTKQNGDPWLRLQVRHASYKGLLMSRIKFSKGEVSAEIDAPADMVQNGNNGIIAWEWYDAPPSEGDLEIIRKIIAEPGVKLTVIGRERTVERELTETERLAMANVFQQALVLGRKP